jgi:hypothetical protein
VLNFSFWRKLEFLNVKTAKIEMGLEILVAKVKKKRV